MYTARYNNKQYMAKVGSGYYMAKYDKAVEVYPIEFNQAGWSDTTSTSGAYFSDYFIFCDANGNNTYTTAIEGSQHYRFKDGVEWGSTASYIFYDCTSLVSITLPSSWGLVTDTRQMFRNCTSLTSVILPESWELVDDVRQMFRSCISLLTLTLPNIWKENITNISNFCNGNTSLSNITLPSDWGNITIFSSSFENTEFTSKASGILISTGYYQSPANGVFPEECYRDDIGLNL